MPSEFLGLALYATPLVLVWIMYMRRRAHQHRRNLAALEESREAGLVDAASLHPVIDPTKCIGCGSCVAACPEMPKHTVLGLVHRKAQLVNPAECIGHGACKAVCPADAITLVFGSERRGVDIPDVKPNFETNVPGIFVAGELGGMGLIRNAMEQGKQAMQSIVKGAKRGGNGIRDVVIVGAGPSGIAATLGAIESKLDYVTIDQDTYGGTVANFPRRKIVMTAPATLPLVGEFKFNETSKEAIVEFWEEIRKKTKLKVSCERLEGVKKNGDHFEVRTDKATYPTRAVLLCIGRRGTPRKLEVPGEDLPKVVYKLIDAAQYQNMHVLVVGGGDSAIESAITIGDQPGAVVTLSHRSESFNRAKRKNREKVEQAAADKKVNVLLESKVVSVDETHVEIEQKGKRQKIRNDAIIVNVGGILPTPLLKEMGIDIQTKFGTP